MEIKKYLGAFTIIAGILQIVIGLLFPFYPHVKTDYPLYWFYSISCFRYCHSFFGNTNLILGAINITLANKIYWYLDNNWLEYIGPRIIFVSISMGFSILFLVIGIMNS